MDLKGIIAISGKPGLYKVAAQGRNNIIVQSLDNDKKFPAFASDKISALDDISFYTYDKDMPLTDVFNLLAEKESFKASIDHKEHPSKLREYLVTFLPQYDADRVYDTDVKKLFQWYNILVEKGIISKEAAAAAAAAKEDAEKEAAAAGSKEKPKKSDSAKTTADKAEKPKAEKKAAAEKPKAEKKAADEKPKKATAKKKDDGDAPKKAAAKKTTKKS